METFTILHLISCFTFTYIVSQSTDQEVTINFNVSEKWLESVQTNMSNLFSDVEDAYITDLFTEPEPSLITKVDDDDDLVNLETMKAQISERLNQAETAASIIRYAAEMGHTKTYNQEFLRDAKCNEQGETMPSETKTYDIRLDNETNFLFENETNSQYSDLHPISLTKSQVVRPVDVYECDRDVKHDVYWTKSLDSVFRNNTKDQEKISYQYFASGQGVMRIYPATDFSTPKPFDYRFQPFYTQSSTLPKLVVIALDSSGSVDGAVTQYMENTFDTIVDFLTDSDLLAVFFFKNDYVHLLPSNAELDDVCPSATRKWYLPATYENKQAFKSAVYQHDNFNGTAEFSLVFTEAEKIFENIDSSKFCTKLLILITDGGKGAATEAGASLTKLLEVNEDMHLIIFLEGPEVYDTNNDDLPVMSCAANGFFYRVGSEQSVRSALAGLINFLSRQLILNNVQLSTWSNLHLQPWLSDFSPVTSLTFPAYGTSNPEVNSFLGIAGSDVKVLKFLEDIQTTWSTFDGDILLINSKGTVLFCQAIGLLPKIFEANWPDATSLPEMNQIEFYTEFATEDDAINTLESSIIIPDEADQSRNIEASFDDLPDYQYVIPIQEVHYEAHTLSVNNDTATFNLVQRRVIHKEPIGNNSFVATLGQNINSNRLTTITKNARAMLKLEVDTPSQNESSQSAIGLAFASEIYCPGLNLASNRYSREEMFTFITDLFARDDFPQITGCMENPAYWHLIYDLHFLYKYIQERNGQWITTDEGSASFIKFNSGLLFYRWTDDEIDQLLFSHLWYSLRSNQSPVITATRAMSTQTDVDVQMRVDLNYFREIDIIADCFRSQNTLFYYEVSFNLFPAMITQPLVHDGLPFAVSGFILTQEDVATRMQTAFPQCFETRHYCYFLDEGGFIVFNSQGSKLLEDVQTTYLLGANLYFKDFCLMTQLIEDDIYRKFEVYRPTCGCNSADVLYSSTSDSLTSFILTLIRSAVSSLLSFIAFISTTSIHMLSQELFKILLYLPHETETLETGYLQTHLCQQKLIKFTYGNATQVEERQNNCTESCQCTRPKPYFAKRINGTNLLLVSIVHDLEKQCPSCSQLSEPRVSLVPETILFEDKLKRSLTKSREPVKEYKVNTCNYRPRSQQNQTRGCITTWEEEQRLFPECDSAAHIGMKQVFLYSLLSIWHHLFSI